MWLLRDILKWMCDNLKCLKRCAFQCIKSQKMGFVKSKKVWNQIKFCTLTSLFIVVLWDEYQTNLHFIFVWNTEWKITWKFSNFLVRNQPLPLARAGTRRKKHVWFDRKIFCLPGCRLEWKPDNTTVKKTKDKINSIQGPVFVQTLWRDLWFHRFVGAQLDILAFYKNLACSNCW